ncbi:MAG: alpha-glucan family phosphorylase [Candidatus Dormibacterales bacterium]
MPAELRHLALDLTWTWDARVRRAFRCLDPELWEACGHNPVLLLDEMGEDAVRTRLAEPGVSEAVAEARAAHTARVRPPERGPHAGAPLLVGYFSLEFGLTECLPLYSGGLGVLAGDHLKAASDMGLPLVGVGLFYRQGFARQRLDAGGGQEEWYPQNDPARLPVARVESGGRPLEVEAPVGDRTVRIGVWLAQVGRVPLYLLDTDLESNPADLRAITDRLYVPEPDRRLRQEIVLGIGGMRALRAAGHEPTVFHLNEGHSFLVAIERIRELAAARQLTLEEARLIARAGVVFTTHTPVAAGSDYFDPSLVTELLGPYLAGLGLSTDRFLDLGRRRPGDPGGQLCTTYMALRTADHAEAVSRLHGAVSRRLWRDAWPGLPEAQVPIGSVTNGVHLPGWISPELAELLARHVSPDWEALAPQDPRWEGLGQIPDSDLWAVRGRLRRALTAFAAARSREGEGLDPEVMTIGFARRFAPYKRAGLLLRDPRRLARLLDSTDRPLQVVFAGKAHPADSAGKEILREVVAGARSQPRIAFIEDYDMEAARRLVQGADVWLNTPRRFLEASGTSGMKAAANGGLNLSVLDGWWDEAYRPGAGWAIPSGATLERPQTDDAAEAEALYRLLEKEVLPAFYDRPEGLPRRWLAMTRAAIRSAVTGYSARRMVGDYLERAYAPAARRVEQLRLLPDWGG